jgi:hypothetical protein
MGSRLYGFCLGKTQINFFARTLGKLNAHCKATVGYSENTSTDFSAQANY